MIRTSPRLRAFSRVVWERDVQDRRWGHPASLPTSRTPDRWLAILMEEIGELAEAVTEIGAFMEAGVEPNRVWLDALRRELVESAAVALSWLEWLEVRDEEAMKGTL